MKEKKLSCKVVLVGGHLLANRNRNNYQGETHTDNPVMETKGNETGWRKKGRHYTQRL